MSIGIVTVAHGKPYQDKLLEWAHAVAALQTPPDQITIATDLLGPHYIKHLSEILLGDWRVVTSSRTWRSNPQVLANEAIAATSTDWICKLDADDLIYPHALNPLDGWMTDVCMFGIRVGDRHLLPGPVTAQQILASPHNLMFAGSPFRRDMWERTPGFQDVIYDDWAFWRSCARAGATFHPTNTIDYEYRIHDHNFSARADHPAAADEVFRLGRVT